MYLFKKRMKLYIKYMITRRCKALVQEELKKLGLQYVVLDYGVVDMPESITKQQRALLSINLRRSGLELLDNKQGRLIEKIEVVIINMIHRNGIVPKLGYADYISAKLGHDYADLNNLFAEVKGMAIQQFIIIQKIDRIKELLLYSQMSFKQIADKLRHSSVAHLSSQFRKVTGLSPSAYRQLNRRPADSGKYERDI